MIQFDRSGVVRWLALGAAVAALVAACSSTAASPTPAPTTAPTTAPSAAPSEAPSAASASPAASSAAETYNVAVATATVGKFLTGEDGKTLYTFKKDTTPGTSACTGDCATNWPPFTVTASDTVKPGDGVTGTLATISRPDGTMQVTYNGAPLYYFAADKAAGDTNGQGVGGFWFVAAP